MWLTILLLLLGIGLYLLGTKFMKSSSKQLSSKIVRGSQLTKTEIFDLWDAFQQFFEREFSNLEDFESFVTNDRHVLLFNCPVDRKLKGFIIISINNGIIQQIPVTVIQGDFFGLHREYRGHSKPLWTLLYFCIMYKIKHIFACRRLYYFFVSYSYKSYLSFGRSMGEYWPCHSKQTPRFEQAILDHFGAMTASDWGTYDGTHCVIRDKYAGEKGRCKLSASSMATPSKISQTLNFFLEHNPGHAIGDCLCICAPINFSNFFSGVKKSFIRACTKRPRKVGETTPCGGTKTAEKNVAWGLGIRKGEIPDTNEVSRVRHFKVHVDEPTLDNLRKKLSLSRLPDQVGNTLWEYGTELGYVKELLGHWLENFHWKFQESQLNSFPQFKTKIDGLDVHFIHIKSKSSSSLPLMLIHGWPSSVYEFYKVIPRLTDPEMHGGNVEDVFDLVIPSIPGYGWSDAPKEPGFDVKSAAQVFVKLMQRLGYNRYVAAGGDWGGFISSYMAIEAPQHCVAIHLTTVLADWEPETMYGKAKMTFDFVFRDMLMSKEEVKGLDEMEKFYEEELGYMHIHTTKPQSIGYALADSPIGLAAWIVEKYRSWSDCNGNLDSKFSKDDLLTMIMIYYITNSITSSCRLYYETKKSGRWTIPEKKVEVPVGVAVFPKEIVKVPRRWAEDVYNIKRWKIMPSGGHWPALEEPELWCQEISEFFRSYRVVSNNRNSL